MRSHSHSIIVSESWGTMLASSAELDRPQHLSSALLVTARRCRDGEYFHGGFGRAAAEQVDVGSSIGIPDRHSAAGGTWCRRRRQRAPLVGPGVQRRAVTD